MVWTSYLLRNEMVGASAFRIYRARRSAVSGFRLRQRSSLALRTSPRQLRPQAKLFLPKQVLLTAKAFPASAGQNTTLASRVKDTERRKFATTTVTVGKAATINAVTQEGAGTAAAATNDSKKNAPDVEELWIVGRLMEALDERLGAKQEKLREFVMKMLYYVPLLRRYSGGTHEIGVIERFSSVISALDGSLEAREGDDFLDWLTFQEDQSSAPAHGNARDADSEGHSVKGNRGGGGGANEAGGARREREKVTKLLSEAAARLNELVALREDSLFRDRGEPSVAAEKAAEGSGSETEAGDPGGKAGEISPSNLPEEELLYQAKLTAHRVFLSQCFSVLSVCLSKEQLKAGLSVGGVVNFARSAYLAGPQDRLGAMFPLFDTYGDGHLDADSVERVVDAAVNSTVLAAERCYAAAARSALDKKASKAMPATMKYALWDVLEVPVKRRCAFAWAEGRKQVGPDEWRVSWEQFAPSRIQNYPEFESTTSKYMAEYSRRRSEWHNQRKARRSSIVYGSALFFGVIFADHLLTLA